MTSLAENTRRWVASLPLLLAAALVGCSDDKPAPGQKPAAAAPVAARPASPLAQLAAPQRLLVERLKSYRLRGEVTLTSAVPGGLARTIKQRLLLSVDGKGGFRGLKEAGEHEGQEVIFCGGELFIRPRHSKFIRRRPALGEAATLLDRLAGHLPAYLELLGPHLAVKDHGEQQGDGALAGRKVRRLELSLSPTKGAARGRGGAARRWRRSIKVTRLTGQALLDAAARVPLRAELKAAWTFRPPKAADRLPRNGIPTLASTRLSGTMSLALTLGVDRLGSGEVPRVEPPPAKETVERVRRRRLELERQLLTGERPIPDDWSKE